MTKDAKQTVLDIIRPLWREYKNARCLSILKGGQWHHTPLINGTRPPQHIEGTRAETKALSSVMSFPEYLEETWNLKKKS